MHLFGCCGWLGHGPTTRHFGSRFQCARRLRELAARHVLILYHKLVDKTRSLKRIRLLPEGAEENLGVQRRAVSPVIAVKDGRP